MGGSGKETSMERHKRLVIALTPADYDRLAVAAARSVRQPEQQLVYYVKRALSRVTTTPKEREVSMP